MMNEMLAREDEYPFEFSVIMSVYNVEPWIHDAVECLINQDFGFENIQLIMVDDGSTDHSGSICDEYAVKYPGNVIVIHKENGGLSSARNTGVKAAEGRYLNFFDPDDLLDRSVFSDVHQFFVKHENETDIVSVPLHMFGAMKGPHPANNKFAKGNRVIDLEEEWWFFQMSLASSFLRADTAKELCFKEDLHMACAEDSKELMKIFLRKPTLGVVRKGRYKYRKRDDSLVGSVRQNPLWYTPYLCDYCKWAFQYAISQIGYIPKNIQYTIMYDLQWKLKQGELPPELLTNEEVAIYRTELNSILCMIDDEVIIAQKQIWTEHKAYALSVKHTELPTKIWSNGDILFAYQNITRFYMHNFPITVEFAKITRDQITMEGWIPFYTYLDSEMPHLIVKMNGNEIQTELFERTEQILLAEKPIVARIGFRFIAPLKDIVRGCFRFYIKTEYGDVWMQRIRYGKYFVTDDVWKNNFFKSGKWKLTAGSKQLNISICTRMDIFKSEINLYREFLQSSRNGAKKAVFARILARLFRLLKTKSIWLICDKANRADDNGEAFFLYLNKYKSDKRKVYFLIGKESTDFNRLRQYGKVVPYMSWRHKLLYLIADYVISAYSHDEINNPFLGYHTFYRDLMQGCKYIFLQHGIIKDDLSKGLNRSHKGISGFITSAEAERQSILNTPAYMYHEKEVWLTGLPRYDRLYHAEENGIVIMPTWRRELFGSYHAEDSRWDLKPGFENSTYYRFYDQLLNHNKLIQAANKRNMRIHFVPHPILFPYIDHFHISDQITLWGTEVVYRDMFARNKLLITDFSSVAFDFAYLRKPIIYAHFDQNHYKEGYFDYERDGFGEVVYDLEGTVERIVEYMENDFELKPIYRKRIDTFFAFNDKNNCQRVYEKILELEELP